MKISLTISFFILLSVQSFAQNFIHDFGVRGKTCKTLASNWTPQWSNIVGYWRMDGSGTPGNGVSVPATVGSNGSTVVDDNYLSYVSSNSMYLFQGMGFTTYYSTFFSSWYYDYINLGNYSAINNLGPLTISFWGYVQDGSILHKSDGGADEGFTLFANASNATLQFRIYYSTGDTYRTTSTALPAIQIPFWALFTITWDGTINGTGIKIFVNGIEETYQGTTSGSGTRSSDASRNLFLGNRANVASIGTLDPFKGKIDELAIWNTALTPTEVYNLYSGQKKCH